MPLLSDTYLDLPNGPRFAVKYTVQAQFSSPSKNEGDVLRKDRLATQPIPRLPSRSAQVPVQFGNLRDHEAGER